MASSKRRGLFTEMMVMTPGLSAICSSVEAARDRHHPDAVERAPGADRRAVKHLVRIQEIRAIGVEMPGIRRQLDGRAHLVADADGWR